MALLPKKLFTTNQSIKTLLIRVAILVVLLGVQPWIWRAVTTRVNDFQQKRFQTQQIDELNRRLADIKQNQKSQQELLSQLDLVVPPKSSLAQVIERLERVGVEQSVKLKVSNIQDKQNDSNQASVPVTPVTIEAQVTGTAQQVLRYLDAIEHLQELTIVPNWSITATTTDTKTQGSPVASSPAPAASSQYTMTFSVTFWLQTTDHAKK